MRRPVVVHRLGRVGYLPAMALMEELVAWRQAGEVRDTLLLLEHHPVITRPRRTPDDLLLLSPEELARRGIDLQPTGRGGLITYHGPGQLVAYPILDLQPDRCDMHRYLRDLEEVLLEVLAGFGIAGERQEGRTGVWVDGSKVAALGVRASRWVTSHGLALNVGEDLSGFEAIVPCGLRDAGVTSLSRLLGRPVAVAEAAERLVPAFCRVFEREPVEGGTISVGTESDRRGRSDENP